MDVEDLGANVSESLETLCKENGKCGAELQGFLPKQMWTPADRQNFLTCISKLFVLPDCTADIARAFRGLMLEVLERAKTDVTQGGHLSFVKHQKLCIALSKVINICPDALRFSVEYMSSRPTFFIVPEEEQPVKKKPRKKQKPASLLAVCQAVYCLLKSACREFRQVYDWSPFLRFLKTEDLETRWFAVKAIALLTGMSDVQKKIFMRKYIDEETERKLVIKHGMEVESLQQERALLLVNPKQPRSEEIEKLSYTKRSLVDSDLSPAVVSVCGVLLPKLLDGITKPVEESLVPVSSTRRNLRSLSLAVASGQPVLLQGPVGCGKTALVEHLARLTGRNGTPDLIKIQLGDQTDSKALLGTYCCTDIPGEFVWQPGPLTQAMTQGNWILLEDIDYAPMDVVSVLVPILESGNLALPSHGGVLKAAPGFQLFATQRLLSSATGLFRQQSSNSSMLERMWAKLNVEPLSRTELQQVIMTTHPQLSTVVDRLLDIYFMLSAGKHELSSDSTAEEYGLDSIGKFLSHDGRLISTRDLIKWCHRISKDFDVTQSVTANVVLQEALDCFCACLSKPDKRLPLAEAIGARLNVTKAKAEYYCCKYKPDVEVSQCSLKSGRANIPIKVAETLALNRPSAVNFAFTRDAAILLERVAVCVANMEPVLLVGETGVGKTSAVQYLAQQTGHHLNVINMNQQSDSADLLGGFKPVDLRLVVAPFREDFEAVFCQSFSRKQNIKFLGHIQECFAKKRWSDLLKLISHTQQQGVKKYEEGAEMHAKWVDIGKRLQQLKIQISQTENSLAFTFLEGTLVKALKAGDWVLLDEINLATTETLECLSGLLESTAGSVVLMERGDTKPIVRHPEFRLFACMNPATDVGKKDLPLGIRNRLTEIFVDELESVPDLKILVNEYLKGLSLTAAQVEGIVKFYLTIRNEAAKKLTDGTGHRPHYSLRTLCRALKHSASNPCGTVPRSLYEGFCLSFLTQVDRSSHPVVEQLICQHILGKSNMKSILKKPLPEPQGGGSLLFEGFWVPTGGKEPHTPENYILTPGVRANLKDLARVVSGGRYPVLIQGETSVGKTSLINWLAQSSGNHCVRVNNHEHTDIQEYVGCYTADEMGKLVFKEGVLVDAMRKGHWIILDELNLAPSDVLEALNRLLDDNRELFIPETQETIKAHPRFMLFATQNPPGQYGGRKVLSRAFRNRFVELHFDEIPSGELQTILHQRCLIPLSYCKKLVAAMLDLQTRRRSTGVFAGKQGYITLRDLFRWAERYHHTNKLNTGKYYDWDQHLADHGYLLLAGRVRKPEEADVIQEVIQKHLKRIVDPDKLFTLDDSTSPTTRELLCQFTQQPPEGFRHIVWTYGMRRMAVLVGTALQFGEPVLLVGETGCGKTSMCQLYAEMAKQKMFAVNCHMHTESSDFLGGLRPVRHANSQEGSSDSKKLFDWVDGPLVTSMKEGAMFLADEISLADDSVLERLNSVLEPERTLLLAEKGTSTGPGMKEEADVIVAKEKFRLFATMNPGGDYGKKELSPALRNRFTEIWCPQTTERQDLVSIIEHNLKSGIHLCNQEDGTSGIGRAIMDFVEWFINNEAGKRSTVSIRDILSWVHFINTCARTVEADGMETDSNCKLLDPPVAYVHGACLVFLDALGFSNTNAASMASASASRTLCLQYLLQQVEQMTGQKIDPAKFGLVETYSKHVDVTKADLFGIEPFYIPKGPLKVSSLTDYAIHAPTTSTNAQRLLRALQLTRPVLLEGSPGVGKTSLVAALARASGNELVRINLSEQTDVTDLFGADLPVEGGEGGQFAWRDGPLLRALKAGHWVVLDELNLASQSVLEGLNACLDHRAEVYVPELGMTFHVQHNKTRLFACQNPLNQGGGRKGLPKSFLNRFTQVYVDPLGLKDLLFITKSMYDMFDEDLLVKMIKFNSQMYEQTMVQCEWGQRGGPWEFNLRDVFRWCDLMIANQSPGHWAPEEYVHLIYSSRMRTNQDKEKVQALFIGVFGEHCQPYTSSRFFCMTPHVLQVGHSFLTRQQQVTNSAASDQTKSAPKVLHHSLGPLEALMKCIEMNWMAVLVGPASSGKTSLVKLLAQLSGHKLQVMAMNSAMDTTELLGGFEQADLSRKLGDIAAKIVEQGSVMVKILLTIGSNPEENVQKSQTLLSLMAQYRENNYKDKGNSTQEEAEYVKGRFRILFKLLGQLQELQQSGDLQDLASELCVLEKKMTKENVSGVGGRFEWVDSRFVRALQSGDWLLIDNVNFCSPSVLDRLNALLEPNGVLSINERGVLDGEVPTIVPHPDFRLILAMDPKHGEISRAMRNRGVEIYILGEEEGVCYDDHDIKTMLHGLGLVGRVPCDTLMSIHMEIKENTSSFDRPSILSVLQAASLTVQNMERGVDLQGSLLLACTDVYVRCQKNFEDRQRARDLISAHVIALDMLKIEQREQRSALLEAGVWPNQVMDSLICCQDATMAMVLRDGAVLASILNHISTATVQFRKDTPLAFSELVTSSQPLAVSHQESLPLLRPAIQVFLELSSQNDWKMRLDWLQWFMANRFPSGKTKGSELGIAAHLLEIAAKGIRALHTHPLSDVLRKQLTELFRVQKEMEALSGDQPLDLRWNGQLVHKLCMAQGRKEQIHHFSQFLQTLNSQWNKLYVLCHLAQQQVLDYEDVTRVPSQKAVCPLQISLAVFNGRQDANSVPHPVLLHLAPFLNVLDEMLKQLIASLTQLTDDHFQKVWVSLLWRSRFIQVCKTSYKKMDTMLAQLSLHWGWLCEKTLFQLFGQNNIPAELKAVTGRLDDILSMDNQASKVQQKISKVFGCPRPFKSEEAARAVLSVEAISRALSLNTGGVQLGDVGKKEKRIACYLCQYGEPVRHKLVQLMSDLYCQSEDADLETFNKAIAELEVELTKHSLYTPHSSSMELDTPLEPLAFKADSLLTKIAMWPVCLYFELLQEQKILLNLTTGGNKGEIQTFIEYCLTFLPAEANHIAPYALFLREGQKDDLFLELRSQMCLQLMKQKMTSFDHMVQRLIQMSGAGADIEETEIRQVAHGSSCAPSLSFSVFRLVLGDDLGHPGASGTEMSAVLIPATAGQSQEKVAQMRLLSRQLWVHAANVATEDWDRCCLDNKWLTSSLKMILKCLTSLSSGEHHSYLEDAIFEVFKDDTKEINKKAALSVIRDLNAQQVLPVSVLNLLEDITKRFVVEKERCVHAKKSYLMQDCGNAVHTAVTHFLDSDEEFSCSCTLAYVGLLQVFLLAPQGPVDPIEKQAIKLQYIGEELDEIGAEVRVRKWNHELQTGLLWDVKSVAHQHPRLRYLAERGDLLRNKADKLGERIATRPTPSQFPVLLQDVRQFLQSVCSVEKVTSMLNKLQVCWSSTQSSDKELQEMKRCLREVGAWQATAWHFVHRMEEQYPLYRDLLGPFLAGVAQVVCGLRRMCDMVDMKENRLTLFPHLDWRTPYLENLILSLCSFPFITEHFPSSLHVAQHLLKDTNMAVVQTLSNRSTDDKFASNLSLQANLLKCCLLHLQNYALVSGRLDSKVLYTLSKVLHHFVTSWREAEERKKQKELEEASLYRYKPTSHGDELTEEEREELDFKQSFPQFDKDFEDISIGFTLESKLEPETSQQPSDEADSTGVTDTTLTEQEMAEICRLHSYLFSTLTTTDWLPDRRKDARKSVNYVDAMLPGYRAAKDLCCSSSKALDGSIDQNLIGAHLLASGHLQTTIKGDSLMEADPLVSRADKPYDIYHDSNVPEVIQCRPVLERFTAGVKALLKDWPDHPTLKQILLVIDRLLSFPVTSALMKFVTGLEVLLQKAQEWESNAARHVSLISHIEEVTALVIQWRKLELKCWSSCLHTVMWKVEEKTSRWWFHVYQLIEAFLSPDEEKQSTEDGFEFQKSLQQFLESGILGDYKAKLNLLYAFHCQVANMDRTPQQELVLNLLWNVYQYYSQFLPNVERHLAQLRAPIERDLKGFVKIARWNDSNFWAMKQAAEKTHRTLHKYRKQFETVVHQPVRLLLTDTADSVEQTTPSDVVRKPIINHFISDDTLKVWLKEASLLDSGGTEDRDLFSKLPAMYQKMRKLCRKTMRGSCYGDMVQAVDELTGDIVSTVQELQVLDVIKGDDKEKQKREAKNINLRKRKALADLFKYLTTIGLSYRRGLNMLQTPADVDSVMNSKPLDLDVALDNDVESSCDTDTVLSWAGCQKYIYRCVARRALFHTALQTPSQELGVANLDRCKGFTEHLMKVLEQQRATLANTAEQVVKLRCFYSTLSTCLPKHPLPEHVPALPDQKDAEHWVGALDDLLITAWETLQQVHILLHCCPEKCAGDTVYPSVLPSQHLAGIALMCKGDGAWTETVDKLQIIINKIEEVTKEARTENKAELVSLGKVDRISAAFQQLSSLVPTLSEVAALFSAPGGALNSLNRSLNYLIQQITNTANAYSAWLNKERSWEELSDETIQDSIRTFRTKLNDVITTILLGVQNLVKLIGNEAMGEGEEEREEEDEGIDLKDGHLTELQAKLEKAVENIGMEKVIASVQYLLMEVKTTPAMSQLLNPKCDLLSLCIPALDQYTKLAQYHVTEMAATHRATAKLLSVLLGVFTELTLKGFCIPPELSDEMEGEGSTEFRDIEGGGLGEGEGVKDVSDQIETEDQLYDAQKEGQEKQEEDTSNEPDLKNEENAIEMSEEFGGKLQDLEPQEGDNESDEDENEENELDKEMGDVDNPEADKLDEQIWGSDDEDDDKEENDREESGEGAGKETESELVAKDDNQDKSESSEKEKEKAEEQDEKEEVEPHKMEEFDETEYDEEQVDPHHGQQPEQPDVEPMDLPDDLKLDEEEEEEGKEGVQGEEENPFDLDKVTDIDETEDDKEEKLEDQENKSELEQEKENVEGMEEEKENEIAKSERSEEKDEEGRPDDQPGMEPQDEPLGTEQNEEEDKAGEEEGADDQNVQAAETYGKKEHHVQSTDQSEAAQDKAAQGENQQEETEGVGIAESQEEQGHEGQTQSKVTQGGTGEHMKEQRKPGHSDRERSLGSTEDKFKRRLQTMDPSSNSQDEDQDQDKNEQADLFEHLKDSQKHYDAQTLDAATAEQLEQQPIPQLDEEEGEEKVNEDDEMKPLDDTDHQEEDKKVDKLSSAKLRKPDGGNDKRENEEGMDVDEKGQTMETSGEKIETATVQRPMESSIHTALEHLHLETAQEADLESLRRELEQQLTTWSHPKPGSREEEQQAQEAWQRYEMLTSSLSQELCEQLRLVLEPSQATKLKGDYRTGKRLNMRKVIPYIASQFRKDKIWLRRTKPSKRNYQIMLAVDDSSSMTDNHSKQLAFESLAVIANALTTLEAGELAVSSFGEVVKVLHPFQEQFSNQSGARILQQFTFEQKKTKIAQLLDQATGIMLSARSRQQGVVTNIETSQLLLVVSDGRGLFLEGMEVVKQAVRRAREANVFVVFVVIDNPLNKDSILDIKVPVFKGPGQIPEIKSYMDHFPFPFYIILRDINSLPQTLSDALRQWFELVTAGDS